MKHPHDRFTDDSSIIFIIIALLASGIVYAVKWLIKWLG